MNIMGFNIQVPGAGLDLIEKYKPVASLLMDIKSEHVAKAKEVSPDTEILFRKEDGKKWRDKGPVEWAQAMWADVSNCPPDLLVLDNEPLGHAATDEFAKLDLWQRVVADWIHGNTPMRVGMFSFPEGNFTYEGPNIPKHFPLSMKVADAVFIHEYWKPHLHSPGMEGYHCLRWDAWLRWFEEAGYPNMPIYVTETGITMAVNAEPKGEPSGPDVGYASEEAKAAGVTTETYLADLEEYHRRCCLEPRIKAVLPFLWCPWPGQWGSFVPTPEMTEKIFTFDTPAQEPEPEPPTNGGEKMVKVFDTEGVELSGSAAEELVQYYTLAWEYPLGLQDGTQYFNLTAVREKVSAPASFIYRVLDQDGNPIINPDETLDRSKAHRAWWWPNMDPGSDDIEVAFPTDWRTEADLGGLNENGEGGSGMGDGAYFHPDDPEHPKGPHQAWVRHPTIPAVILKNIGMRSGTNHDHMDAEWQLEIYQQGEGPSPEPPSEGIPPYEGSILDGLNELETLVLTLGRINVDELLQVIIELKSKLAG